MTTGDPTDELTAAPTIAAFLETVRDEVPAEARHAAVRILLNGLRAVVRAVGGPLPAALLASESARSAGISATTGVMFSDARLPEDAAALCNQQLWTLLLLDDLEMTSGTHPGGPAVTAALALAERRELEGRPVSGRTLLSAIVAGIELQIAVALASAPEMLHERGFATLSVLAPLGSVAAGCVLDSVPTPVATHALGMAAMSGIGMWEMGGTSSAGYLTASAMQSGLAALRAAQAGFEAPECAIDGDFGAFRAYTGKPRAALMDQLTLLGTKWRTTDVLFQPYSGDTYAQASLAALRLLRDRLTDPTQLPTVDRIVVRVNQRTATGVERKYARHPKIHDPLVFNSDPQSRIAAAWLRDAFSFDCTFADLVVDDEVRALRERVEFVDDPAMKTMASATAKIHFVDGTIERADVPAFRGSGTNPFSDDDLSDAFRDAARGKLSEARIERILSAVWALDDSTSAGGLIGEIAAAADG
ncbi:MmgE/PrpD family protein [Parasphingopyxis algicola]|uniref:MmgE/PrpD family protein n=1 Tax=Parasphingopyxis algicola TaxID=2026624 RepID=UPI0015A17971|nr:MmgE/PrpD family protein [Parasphingopyxis algicola]QLC26357.1 MmgE/PrpD family protein [Parasphingopyxis algicola]